MIWKTKVAGVGESTFFAEDVGRRIFFAGGASLQWRVFHALMDRERLSTEVTPRDSLMILSERDPSASLRTGARGPEEHDAPLEWRAPSKD
jgi:hypothetical protein